MTTQNQRKHSFAAIAASKPEATEPLKMDSSDLPKAPLTPPLSDPITSSTASPIDISKANANKSPKMPEEQWKKVTRRGSVASGVDGENDQAKEMASSAGSKWGSIWAPGASIWNDQEKSLNRQNRSFSFSLTGAGDDEKLYQVNTEPLKGEEEDDFSPYSAPKTSRLRSKSSSAIFGLYNEQIPSIKVTGDRAASPSGNIWSGSPQMELRDPSLLHRRSSTQPIWENDEVPVGLTSEELDAFRNHRRFSHAPTSMYNDIYSQQMTTRPAGIPEEFPEMDMRRRHSLAGPLYAPGSSSRYLAEALENLNLDDIEAPTYEDINDYFENTEHRTRAWVEAGKNLQMQSFSQHWPLYVVEFKAGRHDFFFCSDPSVVIKKGDLVIVEADRGKDLGKVIHDNIQNMQQLQLYQANHVDLLAESQFGKDVHPKKVYRLALPNEIALLVSKSQDEAKAMSICQAKIRQRKLPMEVVDAEYQWDRRKLTLYFVSDRRIDFRELVRELFKIYKTRIWMCAVNPLKTIQPSNPTTM